MSMWVRRMFGRRSVRSVTSDDMRVQRAARQWYEQRYNVAGAVPWPVVRDAVEDNYPSGMVGMRADTLVY